MPDDGYAPPRVPKFRGDCLPGGFNEARPCRHTTCRYHLLHDDHGPGVQGGSRLHLQIAARERTGAKETCALDIADQGENTEPVIANEMGLSRFGVQRIIYQIQEKLRRPLRHLK